MARTDTSTENNSQLTGPRLVFLIGAARSGTKFLRDLLAESESTSCVPYDVNYVWRYRNESRPDDIFPPESASEEVATYVRKTLTRMAHRAAGKSAPIIIEKTVSNVFRVPFILQLFPDATFIHLVRDGRDVALSAARQWESPSKMSYLFDKICYFPIQNWAYGLWYVRNSLRVRLAKKQGTKIWGPRYAGIDQDIGKLTQLEISAKQWSESVTAALDGLTMVPEGQKFCIRYEDLVADSRYLRELIRFLELPDPEHIIAHYDKQVSRSKGGSWVQLSKERKARVMSFLEPTLSQIGYVT